MTLHPLSQRPARLPGFTLLELLLAMALGLGLCGVFAQVLLMEGDGMRRLGRRQRQAQEQARTLELLRADLTAAASLSSQPQLESSACPLAGRRAVLHLLLGDGRAITYSLGAPPSSIWSGTVLMRCGPAYGLDGGLSGGTPLNRVVLDGLRAPLRVGDGCVAGEFSLHGTTDSGLVACLAADRTLVGVRLQQEAVHRRSLLAVGGG